MDSEKLSLRSMICTAGSTTQSLADAHASIRSSQLSNLPAIGDLARLRGRSVVIATNDQLSAALALIGLDGIAKQLIILPPDSPPESLPQIIRDAGADAIVGDGGEATEPSLKITPCDANIATGDVECAGSYQTDWIMFTSGTSGPPKMVVHRLSGLTGTFRGSGRSASPPVWATFYDIRRYGGLQIFLRAMLGGCTLILGSKGETLGDRLDRLAKAGVTHVTGTPSHWRRVLMSPHADKLAPAYVRLSGEIADQGILDGLRLIYPKSRIEHAYASTEAGVGFEVEDGQEGFPASFLGSDGEIDLKVQDDSLRIRSNRTALRYLSEPKRQLEEEDGFVDTGDLVERRGARYYFVGRRDGVINVGGQKVHPEEVEAVINRHPGVRMCLVRAKKNSIVGSVVVADIVPEEDSLLDAMSVASTDMETGIRNFCALHLDRHKVPALMRFVASLPMTEGGKLARHNA